MKNKQKRKPKDQKQTSFDDRFYPKAFPNMSPKEFEQDCIKHRQPRPTESLSLNFLPEESKKHRNFCPKQKQKR